MPKSISAAAESDEKKTIIAEVVRSGDKIMLPEEMTIREAITVLVNKEHEEETETGFSENFQAFIWEGCFALAGALDKLYGWFQGMTIPGSFFTPEVPPSFETVATGPGTTVQVPWGRFLVPHIPKQDGYFETDFYQSPTGMICFKLTAKLRKKHSKHFDALCKEIRAQLKKDSLYRGKAVTIKFLDDSGKALKFPEPVFADITDLKQEQLIFSRHIEAVLQANIYTLLTKTKQVRSAGIPLKRGVLLAGPYGTGKTLISTLVKQLATANGWTYLVCQSTAEFAKCVQFARQYQPAVVFCEDIDRVTDGRRDAAMDLVLNTIDGVDAKNTEIMLILTTNEIENIHVGMLRPGRLDAVIEVKRPDAEAVTRLLRFYGGELIAPEDNLQRVGQLLAGQTPAVIREAVERAKLTALSLQTEVGPIRLTEEALVIAADTMRMQLDLLNRPEKEDPHDMQILGEAIAEGLADAMTSALDDAPSLRNRYNNRVHGGALEMPLAELAASNHNGD